MTSTTTRRSLARWAVSTLAVTGIALGGVACTAAPDPLAASTLDTVGHVDGSAALVAVVAGDGNIAAYVCDGDTALGERFTGTVQGNHAELRSASDALLLVDLGPDTTTGTFITAGRPPQHFTTSAATTDEAGYFTAEGSTTGGGTFSAGWIELDDGTQTGVTTSDDGGKGHKDRAPRLRHHRKPVTAGRPASGDPGPIPPGGVVFDPGVPVVDTPNRAPGANTGAIGPRPGAGTPANGNPGPIPPGGVIFDPGVPVVDVPNRAPGGTETIPDEGRGVPAGDRVGDQLGVDPASGGTESIPNEGRGGRLRGQSPVEVAGTVDEPDAQVSGVGPVTPHRVVPNDLKIRRPR